MTAKQGKYPLIFFGAVADLDGDWTKVNSCAVTTAVADLFGETNAFTLNDASGAAIRYIKQSVALASGVNACAIYLLVSGGGTSAASLVNWRDTTASNTDRRTAKIVNTAGVITVVNVTGSTTLDTVIDLGTDGSHHWYLVRLGVTGIVPANANEIWIAPAATTVSDTASTGTLTLLMRSVVMFGRPFEDPKSWSRRRQGSSSADIASGVRDAWTVGRDQLFTAMAKRIFGAEQAGGEAHTGWDGAAEIPGVNAGIDALIAAGQDAGTLRFVPDRTDGTIFIDCYLDQPSGEPPNTDRWVETGYGMVALRELQLTLRSTDDSPIRGF